MSTVARPDAGYDRDIPMDIRWMRKAICDADPSWTADRKPQLAPLRRMAKICSYCPVKLACAEYAYKHRLDSGFYAGVWLPTSGHSFTNRRRYAEGGGAPLWMAAREELRAVIAQLTGEIS